MRVPTHRNVVLCCCLLSASFTAVADEPQAYPSPMPRDISFETVVSTYDYPALGFAVPVIGWKHHPEEIHVTPAGGMVLPSPRQPALVLQPALLLGTNSVPMLLAPEKVTQRLVDGYKPGIVSEWRENGLTIRQVVFGTLLKGEEVQTGREPLVGLSRFTVRNDTDGRVAGALCIRIGEGARFQSMKQFHPAYPKPLTFSDSFIREENGETAACILQNTLGRISFVPAPSASADSGHVALNEDLKSVSRPEYEIAFERSDEQLRVGGRAWLSGMDLYMEMSPGHSSSVAAEVEIINGGGSQKLGWLGRSGLSKGTRPSADEFLHGGEISGPLAWPVIRDALPQGSGKIVLRPFVSVANPVKAMSWEPRVHLVPAGSVPAVSRSRAPESNLLRIAFELEPRQERQVELAVPYFPLDEARAEQLARLNFDGRLKRFQAFWERELNKNAEFIVPDERVRNSYRACLAYNMLLVDRDPAHRLLLPHPDATDYERIWGGDSGVILQSMDRLGYFAETEDYSRIFLARQGMRRPEGDIRSEDGFLHGDARERWLSENGFLIWALAEHYKLTGDKAWLKSVAPRLVAASNWIIRERDHNKQLVNGDRPPHYGLLPRGRATDLGDWDYWFFNDAYSHLGLTSAAEVLPDAGHTADAERIRAAARDYRECILAAVDGSVNHTSSPPFIPLTPYKSAMPTRENLYRFWYSIVSPIYLVEAGVFGPKDQRATWILDTLEGKVLVSGLPRFTPDEIDPHYVYNQSLTQLLRGETDKFIWNLYSLFAFGQTRDTFATIEIVNFRTGGLGQNWDALRQPHMHSNSRVLAMVRIALALEDEGTLHLMMGAPRGWLDDGKQLQVRKAPTTFGELNFAASSRAADGEVTFEIKPPLRRPANLVLHVRPPTKYGQLRSVTVNGKSWERFGPDRIDLGIADRELNVKCQIK